MHKILSNKVLLFISALLLLSNIFLVILLVRTKDSHKAPPRDEKQRYPLTIFLDKEIGFTSEQMDQYEKIRQHQRQRMRPLFEEMRLAKVQFYRNLSKPSVENDTLIRASTEIGAKQQTIELQAFRNFKEIRTVCTDRQKAKYDSLIPGVIEKMWFPPRKPGSARVNNSKNK
jgi:hypothetical protein